LQSHINMNKSLKKKLDDIYVKYKGGIGERNVNLNIVIKGFIIFSFIMISMILFPRGMSYQYADFKVGMVTDKEIITPFDFPILKTEDELEAEKEEVVISGSSVTKAETTHNPLGQYIDD